MVLKHFIPNLENKSQINHKNGIKTDNEIENLEWCTQSENTLHEIRMNDRYIRPPMLGKFGADHNQSKPVLLLTENMEIIEEYCSATEAGYKNNKNGIVIANACRLKQKAYGKTYVYKIDYDNKIKNL